MNAGVKPWRAPPLLIEMILHMHTSGARFPNLEAPAQQEFLKFLLENDLVYYSHDHDCYTTTERGAAWVEKICATPLPVKTWT